MTNMVSNMPSATIDRRCRPMERPPWVHHLLVKHEYSMVEDNDVCNLPARTQMNE
jgi:hypothetical protein